MTCFCCQTFEVWQPLKQTIAQKAYMFLIGAFHSSIIFLNFQQYFSLRNSTLAFKNYSLEFKIQLQKFFLTCCHEILFIENKSSRQTAAYFVSEHGSNATQNFNSLVAKHVIKKKICFHPIRTCFFVTCTRLNATKGILTRHMAL